MTEQDVRDQFLALYNKLGGYDFALAVAAALCTGCRMSGITPDDFEGLLKQINKTYRECFDSPGVVKDLKDRDAFDDFLRGYR